jgi:ribosomal protein S18 acetylase RimI-like enzyme
MEIRTIEPDELEAARLLLVASGWDRAVDDEATFERLVSRSQLAIVAVEDCRVVGFLRALTDGMTNGYISMVVVDESHRGRGIGRAMVRHAMGDDASITWVLRAAGEGVQPFYENLGFARSQVAMERPGARPPRNRNHDDG